MKIGIMAALLEEAVLLKDRMKEVVTETIGGRYYYSGQLYGIDTVLVFSRIGKVAAAITSTTLISKYEVDAIIFTGVAGGVAPDLNVGDIIVGDRLYQHDMDARPIFKQYEIPLTGATFFEPHTELLAKTKDAAEKFVSKDISKYLSKEDLELFSINEPKVKTGVIATGDQFVGAADQLPSIMPHTAAVEMEGAALAQVCHEHGVPFVVIRTISDNADHSAAVDFQKFVVAVATHYAEGVIKNLYQTI